MTTTSRLVSARGTVLASSLMLAISLLSAAWPYCSARVWIALPTERSLYGLSLLTVFSGVLANRAVRAPTRASFWWRGTSVVEAVGLLATVAVVALWSHSNDLFFYWVKRSTPASAWSLLAKEMNEITAGKAPQMGADSIRISSRDLPGYFDQALGKRAEFYYGFVAKQKGTLEPITAVVYGYKSRCWGLYRGGDPRIRWPDAKVIRLNSTTSYFEATG